MKKTVLEFAGQAGFFVKSKNGEVFAIDLYLSDCVERVEGHIGFKRLLPKMYNPSELKIDVLVATHSHLDHFDLDSMLDLMSNSRTRLVAANDCREYIEKLQLNPETVWYAVPGDNITCGDFQVRIMPCDHGKQTPDAIGVLLRVDEKQILFTGDTCLRLDWVDAIKKNGEVDVLIAPINGAYGNLNEAECGKLAEQIRPRLLIPCHCGMFAAHGGSYETFRIFMNEQYPDIDYMMMTPMEQIEI